MAALTLEVREKWFPAVAEAPPKLVLDNVRLAVPTGERLALIGPSGCGKTTLLNIVAGLERTFAGRLELAAATRLAYVFQEPRLLPWRTVEDNLRLVLPETPDPTARIGAALAEVGLGAARHVYALAPVARAWRAARRWRAPSWSSPTCCCSTSRSSRSTSRPRSACGCCSWTCSSGTAPRRCS